MTVAGLAWERLEPTTVTQVGWRTIVTKTFRMPDGTTHTWETINPEGAHYAGVIAVTADHQVITAEQFRPGPERLMYEIPGGVVEPGEDAAAAAEREFTEETGYVPGTFERLGELPRDAYLNGTWHYFFATGCGRPASGPVASDDPLQFTRARLLSIETFLDNARQGRMTDVPAVFLAYDRLKQLQKEA